MRTGYAYDPMEFGVQSFKFTNTTHQLPVMGFNFGSRGPKVLILAGVHGDEWEGIVAAKSLIGHFYESFTYKLQLTIVPMFNLDGVLSNQRKNTNSVDLNRNLPTNDWSRVVTQDRYHPGIKANSEVENQGLVDWLSNYQPRLVISLHSWKPLLNTNGHCQFEAEVISKLTGYEIRDSIGYSTPGCLGTYCGLERDMPTLTYEIERNLPPTQIVEKHVPALLEALKVTEERF